MTLPVFFRKRMNSESEEIKAEICRRDGKHQAVRSVHKSAVAGDDVGKILHTDIPLDQRFCQVPDLTGGGAAKCRHHAGQEGNGRIQP